MAPITISAILFSCERESKVLEPLFISVPSIQTHIDFENQIKNEKNFNIFNYRNFYNGGGVAIGDINNDGLPDIFLVSNMADNKLYLNDGNFEFRDITSQAGVKGKHSWSTGVTFADINGDGFLDLYVCNSGNRENDDRANELFINQGNGTFIESAKQYGLDDQGLTTHAAFFDYDKDGDLDAYILNNSFIPISKLGYRNLRNERDSLGGDKLLRNENGVFKDVSQAAGIYGSLIGFGLGITVGDINNDNWPDIYISNDFYERDYLYINNRDGTFSETLKGQMGHTSLASMGADLADINNDGALDLFVTDMLPGDDKHLKEVMTYENYDLYNLKLSRDYHHQITQNMLQLNNDDGTFSEIARLAGVEATDWSWGALLFDMDNDGWKDIFVANGIAKDLTDLDFLKFLADETTMLQLKQKDKLAYTQMVDMMPSRPVSNYALRNNGHLRFTNKAADWGLEGPGFSNGAAYGDLDNDGDLDMVVNNVNSPASVYNNTAAKSQENHFVTIKLEGYAKNKFGIGTRIRIFQQNRMLTFEQMPTRGFQSSVDYKIVAGIGENPIIDSIQVIWPDDRMQTLNGILSDRHIVVRHANASKIWQNHRLPTKKLFADITQKSRLDYHHRESEFVDYYRDPLLKQMHSSQGPGIACGDVNGDGRIDIVFSGGRGQGLSLFLQQKDFTFTKGEQKTFEADSASEDVALCLVDIDQDKDLDLFVVTGSNEFDRDDAALIDRLYINDGKGNFLKSNDLPQLKGSGSCVAAADFDRDGDIDLFVGGRLIPGQYGYDAPSYLLINNGRGQFKNYTTRYIQQNHLGMVTDAVWQDIDGDFFPELVVVGDWMSVTIFKNEQGKTLKPQPFSNLQGWWNCITATDIDNDQDIDFIIGNSGLNSRIRADSLHPAELYVSDFDSNGAVEQVISCVGQNGTSYPMVLKHDLERQLPFVKKRFVKNGSYAGKTIHEIFTLDELRSAVVKKVNQAQSGILINDGHGKFDWQAFPLIAQISPVYAAEALDTDGDGVSEIILAGNFYDVLPEIGRYDANHGQILKRTTDATFEIIPSSRSGFFIHGQVRDVKLIKNEMNMFIVVAKNDDKAQIFQSIQD